MPREQESRAPSGVWTRYNSAQEGRGPRQLVLDAIAAAGPAEGRTAIDLGAGRGIETAALLDAGWTVTAIDGDDTAGGDVVGREGLDLRRQRWQNLTELPPAHLIHASYALPFCPPELFAELWALIRGSLQPGGVLAVDLFGERDSWFGSPRMTFHDEGSARKLFDGLELIAFDIDERDGRALDGPKHWHVFHVIARHP